LTIEFSGLTEPKVPGKGHKVALQSPRLLSCEPRFKRSTLWHTLFTSLLVMSAARTMLQRNKGTPTFITWPHITSQSTPVDAAAAQAAPTAVPQQHGAAAPHAELPIDFDWKTYLRYNPDLAQTGINTEQRAILHYRMAGHREGRMYQPLNVVLRYTACGGLINQHYCHIAALTLGASLGAHVVMPPALQRTSFDPARAAMQWAAQPLRGIWDVDALQSYWRGAQRGLG
jgi:hypothetical protein